MYGDEEEVRRLFRFLRSEHVGTDVAEFHLHLAHFELCTGKPEKCLATLENASRGMLSNNELVKKALVEFRLVGTFRLDPLVMGEVSKFAPPMTPLGANQKDSCSSHNIIMTPAMDRFHMSNNTPLMKSTPLIGNAPLIFHQPPPTPISQPIKRDSPDSASVPRVSPEVERQITSSAVTTRVRRLGITGPPKRTVIITGTTESPSNDWTVPQESEMMVDSAQNNAMVESLLNSPSKTGRMDLTGIEKENMSLTTISPMNSTVNMSKKERSPDDDPIPTTKSRAVRVNGKSYKVLQLIGRGGSSKVFKVLSPDNSILALKKVGLKNLDETTLSGYLNEINLLLSLSDSAHIIKLVDHEINRDANNLYMVMEYGEADLGKLLRGEKRETDLNFIRYMWQQMLLGVQTVHSAKIVHCDLKPANFLLVSGRLKLIDFGISKAIMNDTTNIVRENQVGTVNYMSPEALQESSASERGRIKIGRASDVWSLGCILYEMAYGKPPFAQFTLIQRLHKILDPAYDIEYGPCEPMLLDVIRGCLQRQAKRRPSLEELLVHPFLVPRSTSFSSVDSVVVTKKQIGELMEKFTRHIPQQLDPVLLSERIFQQWQRESNL